MTGPICLHREHVGIYEDHRTWCGMVHALSSVGATEDVDHATCLTCLDEARRFAWRCEQRLDGLRAQTGEST